MSNSKLQAKIEEQQSTIEALRSELREKQASALRSLGEAAKKLDVAYASIAEHKLLLQQEQESRKEIQFRKLCFGVLKFFGNVRTISKVVKIIF